MHILLLPSWYPDAAGDISGVFFRDQALALRNYGHQVGVIAPQVKLLRTWLSNPRKPTFPHFEDDDGLMTYRQQIIGFLPRVPYGNYWLFKRAARKLLVEYINNHGVPDIIHAHSAISAGAAAVELADEFNIPVVLTEHSTAFARNAYFGWQLKLAQRAITASHSIISVSPALGDLLGQQFPVSKDHWRWIANVVADRFKDPEESAVSDRPVRFINLAIMQEKKGQFDLIEAFHLIVENGVNAELWLAGDGPIRIQLEERVKKLNMTSSVRFLGQVAPDSVPELLMQSDIMVLSSHYETFGVVAAEALMAGLPVVATRCGGPECIVGPGDGLLVPPKHPEELASAMSEISESLSDYSRKEISARARNRFSGPAIAALLTAEYERVISGESRAISRV